MADGGWRMADIYIIGSTEHRELLIIDYRNTIHPAHPATTKGSIQFPMIGSPVATFVQRLSRTSIHLRNMSSFPVAASIQDKLRSTFEPTHLEVINDSHMHNVPKDSETHFKVVVVSSQFDSVKSPIQRHRLINAALAEELEGPVHALSIVAKSPSQWDKNQAIPPSPNCQGGDGSLPKRNG